VRARSVALVFGRGGPLGCPRAGATLLPGHKCAGPTGHLSRSLQADEQTPCIRPTAIMLHVVNISRLAAIRCRSQEIHYRCGFMARFSDTAHSAQLSKLGLEREIAHRALAWPPCSRTALIQNVRAEPRCAFARGSMRRLARR
jgi:hypothetical protein